MRMKMVVCICMYSIQDVPTCNKNWWQEQNVKYDVYQTTTRKCSYMHRRRSVGNAEFERILIKFSAAIFFPLLCSE